MCFFSLQPDVPVQGHAPATWTLHAPVTPVETSFRRTGGAALALTPTSFFLSDISDIFYQIFLVFPSARPLTTGGRLINLSDISGCSSARGPNMQPDISDKYIGEI